MKFNNSYIHLKDVRFYAFHGVLPQERTVGAYFILNVCVKVDFAKAAISDELSDTVSYADIYRCAKTVMQTPCNLLEHVAQKLCTALYEKFPEILAINVTLEKENAPIGIGAQGLAGITLETSR